MNAHRIIAEYEDGSRETVGWCDVMCTVPILNVDGPQKFDDIKNFVSSFTIGREGHWPFVKAERKRGSHEPFEAVDPQGRKVQLHVGESMFDVAMAAWEKAGSPTSGLEISIRINPDSEGICTRTERL